MDVVIYETKQYNFPTHLKIPGFKHYKMYGYTTDNKYNITVEGYLDSDIILILMSYRGKRSKHLVWSKNKDITVSRRYLRPKVTGKLSYYDYFLLLMTIRKVKSKLKEIRRSEWYDIR